MFWKYRDSYYSTSTVYNDGELDTDMIRHVSVISLWITYRVNVRRAQVHWCGSWPVIWTNWSFRYARVLTADTELDIVNIANSSQNNELSSKL